MSDEEASDALDVVLASSIPEVPAEAAEPTEEATDVAEEVA